MDSPSIFIGRQPILDANGNTVAYELLYREDETAGFPGIDGTEATSRLLYNIFTVTGLEKIVGERPAFINFTKEMLLAGPPVMDPKRVVIEILEDVVVDLPLVEAVEAFV